jgi:hypothetical protein
MVLPPGLPTLSLALLQDLPIPLPCKLKVPLASLLCLLLKGMQDVDSFCELRHIKDPMLCGGANSQLVNARAYVDHGLPVIRFKPLLNQVKLVAGNTPRIFGEDSQVLESGACPEERFHGREGLYNFLYTGARARSSGAYAA